MLSSFLALYFDISSSLKHKTIQIFGYWTVVLPSAAFSPDHLSGLDGIPLLIDVAFDRQVAVGVVGRPVVGHNAAGDAKSSGN